MMFNVRMDPEGTLMLGDSWDTIIKKGKIHDRWVTYLYIHAADLLVTHSPCFQSVNVKTLCLRGTKGNEILYTS